MKYYKIIGSIVENNQHFIIKERKSLLGFPYWKTLTYIENNHNAPIVFYSYYQAEDFIKNVL